jgi:hypothetical protein
MKNLILLLALFIPFSLVAQDKDNISSAKTNNQTEEWMSKISSDSEMRSKMMSMMIDKTKGNKVEMTKLVNSLMDDPEMHKIMMAMQPGINENRNISVEPRGMSGDSIKVMKMSNTTPIPVQKK